MNSIIGYISKSIFPTSDSFPLIMSHICDAIKQNQSEVGPGQFWFFYIFICSIFKAPLNLVKTPCGYDLCLGSEVTLVWTTWITRTLIIRKLRKSCLKLEYFISAIFSTLITHSTTKSLASYLKQTLLINLFWCPFK